MIPTSGARFSDQIMRQDKIIPTHARRCFDQAKRRHKKA
jgi:hypothetical protein